MSSVHEVVVTTITANFFTVISVIAIIIIVAMGQMACMFGSILYVIP